jgi:hypothetical protein
MRAERRFPESFAAGHDHRFSGLPGASKIAV